MKENVGCSFSGLCWSFWYRSSQNPSAQVVQLLDRQVHGALGRELPVDQGLKGCSVHSDGDWWPAVLLRASSVPYFYYDPVECTIREFSDDTKLWDIDCLKEWEALWRDLETGALWKH